jgi:poly(beta-D-mannuronate) lyase
MRKWALATLATGWVELKFMPGSPVKENTDIERWLALLADKVVQDWDGCRWPKPITTATGPPGR